MQRPDDDLEASVARARRGDADAWRAVFADVFPRVYRYVDRRIGGTRHDVEDVVQETFAQIVHWMPTRYTTGDFRAWCIAIARQRLHAKHRARPGPMPVGDAIDAWLGREGLPEDAALRREVALAVDAALTALPDRWATVLRWKYVDECSFSEIASRLGTTESSAQSLAMRAKEALRAALRDQPGDDER